MSEQVRVSRSASRDTDADEMSDYRHHRGGGSKMPWVILVLVVIVLAVLGFLFRDKLFAGSLGTKTDTVTSKASGYQSVFLANGQVYFGKLSNSSGDYVTLKDIYYLQVTQPPLQGSQQGNQSAQQQQQQGLTLVKLGNELHGPLDSMQINRTQILFYEDMKEDGQVVQAIRQYQKNPPAAATPQTKAPTTQTLPTNSSK